MEELRESVALLEGGARLLEAAALARARREDDDGGLVQGLAQAGAGLESGAAPLSELEEPRDLLLPAPENAAAAARVLERFTDGAELDPSRLEEDQARLATLEEFCRKYRRTESELLTLLDQLERQLDAEEYGDQLPARLSGPLAEAQRGCEDLGGKLVRERHKQAKASARKGTALLAQLVMPEAELCFEVEPRRDPDGLL